MPTVEVSVSNSLSLGGNRNSKFHVMIYDFAFEARTWSDEGRLGLFSSQHQHGEDKFRCQKHLDEDSLGDGCSIGQSCGECRFPGKHAPN